MMYIYLFIILLLQMSRLRPIRAEKCRRLFKDNQRYLPTNSAFLLVFHFYD